MQNMNHLIKVMLVAASLIICSEISADPAKEIAPDSQEMKLSAILQDLSAKGYVSINDVEMENDVLSVEGINKEGAQFQLHVDPKTGKILKQTEMQTPKYSMIDVVKKIEDKGNLQIVEVEFDEGMYKVKATTADEQQKEMQVDPQTGEIKTEE